MLVFTFGDVDKERVTDLVEFQLCLILFDMLIMELEILILEISKDWHLRVEINWSLLFTEAAGHTWVLCGLLLELWSDDEVNTWSLSQWVSVILGEVIFLTAYVILLDVDVSHGHSSGMLDFFLGPGDISWVEGASSLFVPLVALLQRKD